MTDIQFGEVEYQGPEVSPRPDEDAHFAVVECGECLPHELAIYVDLDVMRDMEGHARTNTDVELGGVMLGGQFTDQNGKPFVVVSDSLRAEHFEATKGSFKFTHETWQEITRRRDEFAADLQMVGWYHTHPDWGVFLSGMDLFICDHFFNRPLDVALVIDPCRGDRGWFQWTDSDPPKTRETRGFFLTTNRFREDELNFFKSMYTGEGAMSTDPRYSGAGGSIVQPVVNINDQRTPIQNIAIMGMLTIQLLVLALIGYKLLANDNEDSEKEIAKIENRLQMLGVAEKAEAQERAFKETIFFLTNGSNNGATLADELTSSKLKQQDMEIDLRGQRALTAQVDSLQKESLRDLKSKTGEIAKLKKDKKELMARSNELYEFKVNAEKALKEEGKTQPVNNWVYLLGAGILGILGLAGGYWLGGKDLGKEDDDEQTEKAERIPRFADRVNDESIDDDDIEIE